RNARDRGELRVVTNEVGTPTGARDLAEIIVNVTLSGKYGLYHATNEGICSRFDFAKQILQCAGWTDIAVNPTTSEELGLPCPRPPYSPLDNMCLRLQGFPAARYYMDPLNEYVQWLMQENDF
ncbi:MAG: sugar nucleotide-binding protein, partial [Actinobacteria bacterium]|nr:sugar nucleotide-binding protein [Actinomycetota bacterium]